MRMHTSEQKRPSAGQKAGGMLKACPTFLAVLFCCPLIALEPGEPSPIAILTAAARAYASHDPDPTVRNPDWLADPLLSTDEIALLKNHPMGRAVNQDFRIATLDPEVSSLARPILAMTRFTDELLERSLRAEFSQVVILNAGLDSRAYRMRPLLIGRKLFELDRAATQSVKKRRVEAVLGPAPAYVSFVVCDLARDDPGDALKKAGFLETEKTFFVWENGSMYFSAGHVERTLRSIAGVAANGSVLAMDFAHKSQVDEANRDPKSIQNHWDKALGEPWVFGVPDEQRESFFRELGFTPRQFLNTGSTEAAKRYLTRRDGTVFGPQRGAPGSGYEEQLARWLVELEVTR